MPYARRYKPVVLKPIGGARRVAAAKRASTSRMAVVGAGRGFLRTGGYYGRFRGRRANAGGELKFFDTVLAATNVPAVGVVNPNLNIVATGDGEQNRIGRKIQIKSVWLKGSATLLTSATAAAATDTVRMILVQDKQANGAAFAVTDVLQNADYLGFRNVANTSRFNILWDKTIDINASAVFTAVPAGLPMVRNFNNYLKCNIPIEFDASLNTGVITTQRSNSIALLMISKNNNISQVQYRARIRYADN